MDISNVAATAGAAVIAILPDVAMAAGVTTTGIGNTGLAGMTRDIVIKIWLQLAPLLSAIPAIPAEIARTWRAIASGNNMTAMVVDAGLVIAAMLLAAWLARYLACRKLASGPDTPALAAIFRRFGIDFAGALALITVAVLGGELLLSDTTLADFLGLSLVEFLVSFEIARIIPAVLYRPGEPSLRLMPGTDAQVQAGRRYFHAALFTGLGFPALIPVFTRGGMDWNAAQALAVLMGTLTAVLGLAAAWRFCGTGAPPNRHWRWLVPGAAATFWLAWCYGVVSLDFPFFFLVVKLGAVLTFWLVADRLVAAGFRGAADPDVTALAEAHVWQNFGAAIRRVVYVLALAAASMAVIHWLAEVGPGFIPSDNRVALETSAGEGVAIFCLGYLLFEAVMGWMRARFARPPVTAIPGLDDDDIPPATRLATVLPLLRGVIGTALLGTTTLIALSKLGINTTPILAGAGILGLAVSFGSQSLVRDIVAGIFYMVDDAFRLGEYIEASKLKGNVEHISLRSIRLRHQNGQIHTIPFGQMGSVTNFSRDWVTMKFNLRLARDVEIDVVRKTVKTIGLEMLEDEEFGKEFIQPLKMQGIADILENALLMRFKFTVKPGKPTLIQREAIKRIVNVFAMKGINFAQNSVLVHSSSKGEPDEDETIAAAAAPQTPTSMVRGAT